MKSPSLVFGSFLLSFLSGGLLVGSAAGGQAVIMPVTELVGRSDFIAVVKVTKVVVVDVPTGGGRVSRVYVAEAEVEQSIKPASAAKAEKTRIAIVGSTIPRSSAVWQPIEEKRYLAFLNAEQGHFHYGIKWAFREVKEDGRVAWYDYARGDTHPVKFVELKIEDAIARVEKADKANRAATSRAKR
ncbi:MAG: hypothetical protein QGG36_33365 [Pirellulaceae bacterium]|nr:hypothetical protein [Pirellulaceae bacterium]